MLPDAVQGFPGEQFIARVVMYDESPDAANAGDTSERQIVSRQLTVGRRCMVVLEGAVPDPSADCQDFNVSESCESQTWRVRGGG
jgi:hypothetical protein